MKALNFLFILLVAVAVVGCSSKAPKKQLEGERISILKSDKALEAHRAASAVPVTVPKALNTINWPQVGGTPSHVVGNIAVAEEIRQVWRTSVGGGSTDSEKLLNPPVMDAGKIVLLTANGDVVAINAENGNRVWRRSLKTKEKAHLRFSGGVAISNGFVFVTTGVGQVVALNLTDGKNVWQQNIGVPIRTAPAIKGGNIYITAHNNRLFVLAAKDGSLVWTHSGIDEPLALLGGAAPAIGDDIMVVPYSSGEIYALRVKDGRYLWHDALSFNVQADPFSSLVDVDAAPVIDGERIYAVNYNGQISAFNLKNGERLWERNISATQMPWLAGNMLYLVTEQGDLVAIEKTMGIVTWITKLDARLSASKEERYWSGPVMAGGRLIVVSNDGSALSVDPKTGEVMKHVKLPSGVNVPPVIANGTLYFLTDRGQLLAYR